MANLAELVMSAKTAVANAKDMAELELVRVEYFGKKGHLTTAMMSLKDLAPEDRPKAGQVINEAKQQVQSSLNSRKEWLEQEELTQRLLSEKIDVTLAGREREVGTIHPISQTIERIITFFSQLGFSVKSGPEIENSYYNFDALNMPGHHPARASHDTFWFDTERLLRTQTSAVQIRTMEKTSPPLRILAPGRTYRNDYDQTHTPMFHQMEGLIVDKNITFANLKYTLHEFLRYFFGEELEVRFRASYFPFTEPSAEVDIMFKDGKWLEILGCGMVHPEVLKNVGIDPEVYSGFAFGMGIERLTMIRYGVTDLRAFFENDIRFLKQFK